MDVFRSRLFETTTLVAAINAQPYLPNFLGELGIFEEAGVATTTVFMERRNGILVLVPITARGAPGTPLPPEKSKGFQIEAPRLMVVDSLLADSVQNVRAFGSPDQLVGVEQARDAKLATAARSLDLTLEYHRLGAIQGIILDADGSPWLNLFDVFGVAAPAEVDFNLDADEAGIRLKISAVKRLVRDALGEMQGTMSGLLALCGDEFFDALTNHPEVTQTYLNQQAANSYREGDTLDAVSFGGVTWVNYQGYGDVRVASTKCRFIPLGVPGLFKTTFVPADYWETVNTIGLPRYSKAEMMKFDRGVELESQSNPLTYCTRPEALVTGRLT